MKSFDFCPKALNELESLIGERVYHSNPQLNKVNLIQVKQLTEWRLDSIDGAQFKIEDQINVS